MSTGEHGVGERDILSSLQLEGALWKCPNANQARGAHIHMHDRDAPMHIHTGIINVNRHVHRCTFHKMYLYFL